VLAEAPYALLLSTMVLVGLYLANLAYDAGLPQYESRKIGHAIGGWVFLVAVLLFASPWWPIITAGAFTLLLAGARLVKPSTFRGVGGSARAHAWAELWFPGAAAISLGIGWGWLGEPWLALTPILFMAWGDCVTGLIRSSRYGREVKGNWGSVGMLGLCLMIAYLFTPYWIAVAGAGVATAAERFTPLSRGFWDDNWTIIASSLALMTALWTVWG